MVGWSKSINRFFNKELNWNKVPKRLTSGIKKFIRKKPNDVPHRWQMSTNPKTGKKTLWSLVRNSLTKSGNPRIQRILTPKGIRYLLEGQKGFIPTHRAKTMMGPSSKADPESKKLRSHYKHILGGLKEKYKPKGPPELKDYELTVYDLVDAPDKPPPKRTKDKLKSVPKISKPLNRMLVAPVVPETYYDDIIIPSLKGRGPKPGDKDWEFIQQNRRYQAHKQGLDPSKWKSFKDFYRPPRPQMKKNDDPDLWDYDQPMPPPPPKKVYKDIDLWDYNAKPPKKRKHSYKLSKAEKKELGVYKTKKQKKEQRQKDAAKLFK